MVRFNAKVGRHVNYKFDPWDKSYHIESINSDGSVNIRSHLWNFRVLNVPVDQLCPR